MVTTTTLQPGTTTTTAADTPDWYGALTQNFGNTLNAATTNANALSQNWYNKPLVAGLDPLQQQALQQADTAAGGWQPMYNQGATVLGGAGQQLNAQQNAASGMTSGLPSAQAGMGTAGNLYGAGVNAAGNITSGLAGANSAYGTAGGMYGAGQTATNAMTSGLNAADSAWRGAGNLYGQAAAGTQGAGTYDAAEMQKHLNPYLSGVNAEIARLGQQNLEQNVMPSVNSTFSGAGQFGGTRNSNFLGNAIDKNNATILGSQANAMNQAYGQAAQDYLGWGQLGMQGAGQLNNIGQNIQGLGTTIANTPANIYGQQASNLNNLGQSVQGLGTAQANTAANLYGQQATQLGNLGQNFQGLASQQATLPANIYGAQAGQFGNVASGLSNLGSAMGNYGIQGQGQAWTDIANQLSAGAIGQGQNQKVLDASYADWQKSIQTPLDSLKSISSMIPNTVGLYGNNTTTSSIGAPPTASSTADTWIQTALAAVGGDPTKVDWTKMPR